MGMGMGSKQKLFALLQKSQIGKAKGRRDLCVRGFRLNFVVPGSRAHPPINRIIKHGCGQTLLVAMEMEGKETN
jgi:hypothetical protein